MLEGQMRQSEKQEEALHDSLISPLSTAAHKSTSRVRRPSSKAAEDLSAGGRHQAAQQQDQADLAVRRDASGKFSTTMLAGGSKVISQVRVPP
jgi:hypothetical protein